MSCVTQTDSQFDVTGKMAKQLNFVRTGYPQGAHNVRISHSTQYKYFERAPLDVLSEHELTSPS